MSQAQQPSPETALRALAEGAAAVAHAVNLDAALGQLLDLALDAAGSSRGAILVQNPAQAELEVAVARGYADASLYGVIDAAGGESAFTEAASRPSGTVDQALAEVTDGLITLLPLIASTDGIDQVVGILVVERRGGVLADEARTILYALADLASAAVDRSQVRSLAVERADWAERVASTDTLTGLANALVLGRVLEHELARAGRQGQVVSVAVFDVDGFRALNETAGRDGGDRVLQEVAATIAGAVRMVDSVARMGGDEFAVVAPGAGGRIMARRIMDAIMELEIVADHTVTVSAGVARFPDHGTTADELLASARQATRSAKASSPGTLVDATTPPWA